MIAARLIDKQGVLLEDKGIEVSPNTAVIIARDTRVNQHDRVFVFAGLDQSRLIVAHKLAQASCLVFVEADEWYVHDDQHPGPRVP